MQELGFLWLNVIIMIGFLAYLLYKPVKNFMNKRAERVSAQIGSAEASHREAMVLKKDYETKLLEIDKERAEVLDTAKAKAVARSEEIIRDARSEADLIRGRAESDIGLEVERVQDEMRTRLIELSAAMAGRFIRSSLSADEHSRLVDEALADMGDVRWAE